jgi:hypothetical protein
MGTKLNGDENVASLIKQGCNSKWHVEKKLLKSKGEKFYFLCLPILNYFTVIISDV